MELPKTPPVKVMINPEMGDSDFASNASSEVYRLVPADQAFNLLNAKSQELPILRERLDMIDLIVRYLYD